MAPRFSSELPDQAFDASPTVTSFTYTLPAIIDEDSSSVLVSISSGFNSSIMTFEGMTTLSFFGLSESAEYTLEYELEDDEGVKVTESQTFSNTFIPDPVEEQELEEESSESEESVGGDKVSKKPNSSKI